MIEKIFDFLVSNPFILVPFIVTIPSVHFLKKIIKETDKDIKSIKVIGLSFIISFIFTLIPAIAYNNIDIIDIALYQISFSVVCVILSSGIVIIFDKARMAGIIDAAFNYIKNLLNKSK